MTPVARRRFSNVALIGHEGVVTVDVADGMIERISPERPSQTSRDAPRAQATRWTSGLVDIHTHGGGGHGFDDADPNGLDAAINVHHSHGTRRAVVSLVSASPRELVDRMETLRVWIDATPFVHGIHLEGPFLAHGRRGAHAATALTAPVPAAVDAILEAGAGLLRQITIAPELPGASDAIDRFVAAGVVVAVGHTEADMDTAARAFDRGASLLTHAHNAMPAMLHRAPGPLGAALDRSHVTIEVISDGIHVAPVVLRSLFASAPGRVALVSDAMSATGLGDGNYSLGELSVTVREGIATLAGTEVLAGSTLTLDRAVQNAVEAGVHIDDAIIAATTTPARALGIDLPPIGIGSALADIVAIGPTGERQILAE